MTLLEISSGDTAWVLASAALVLLMTPGLAMFYGGMVRANSTLNMIMMSFVTMGTVGVMWALYGYGMAFGNSVGGAGIIGNPIPLLGLHGALVDPVTGAVPMSGTIPTMAFVAFQAGFAIIAVALVSGAVADRMTFPAWILFTILWGTLVYFPAAHWVFAFNSTDPVTNLTTYGGWIANKIGVIDFAGGTAIHINAGIAALMMAIVLKPRIGFGSKPMRPHNMTLVMLGAGILWFGWFGFNAGSALGANGLASHAWVTTLVATSAAMLAWLVTERIRDGHFTSLGAASGVVAGLVAITPACSSVTPIGAIVVGVVAGVLCALAVGLKFKFGYDDSLDVVGVHLVGGLTGTLLIGFLASPGAPGTHSAPAADGTVTIVKGLFYGGDASQLGKQAIGAFSVLIYSAIVTLLIGLLLKSVMKIRVAPQAELDGIDLEEHAEVAYDLSSVRYTAYRVNQRLVIPAAKPEEVKA
jgi:Amt family ammonium transporter